MPRPKSILWVDDEVESLTSHIMFLEEQGFAVETSTHGDDALVLLQRQPYGVVLLDEQMPGRRGLDLFQAIRAIDHGMPVVMVTKSEEPDTLKDAIGAEISDYLIKPVNPRQILSVVTRLLEGDRIKVGGGPDRAVILKAAGDFLGEIVAEFEIGRKDEALILGQPVNRFVESRIEGKIPAANLLIHDGTHLPAPGVHRIPAALVANFIGEA